MTWTARHFDWFDLFNQHGQYVTSYATREGCDQHAKRAGHDLVVVERERPKGQLELWDRTT